MSILFSCRGVRRRFTVGVGNCQIRAEILRGVDLDVRESESVAIVGSRGAGKSTLLLCIAGLLKPDAGEIHWRGDSSIAVARRITAYHWTAVDLARVTAERSSSHVRIHLLDFAITPDMYSQFSEWCCERRMRGDAILIATRDEVAARVHCSRVLFLQHGLVTGFTRTPSVARVAERPHLH